MLLDGWTERMHQSTRICRPRKARCFRPITLRRIFSGEMEIPPEIRYDPVKFLISTEAYAEEPLLYLPMDASCLRWTPRTTN